MKAPDRRKYPRLRQHFEVRIFKSGVNYSLEGRSTNVSQGGAFVKVKNWRSFWVYEQTIIAFSLPPEYTGQGNTIFLQGEAIVTRIDKKNGGIAITFTRNFRQFEPVILPDAVGQS